jgi:hypothetical protein
MTSENLGRVQGASLFTTKLQSNTSIDLATLIPNNIKPLVGDCIIFVNGDVRRVESVSEIDAICENSILFNIKGEKGDKGDANDSVNNILMKVSDNTNASTYDLVFSGTTSSSDMNTAAYRCRTAQNSNALTYQPSTGNLSCSGNITAAKVFNAVFNDYAEYRLCAENIKPGYIVTEDDANCDYVKLCKTKHPKSKMFVVSDTFGACMGEEKKSVPVGLTGRVLVYVSNKEKLKVGDIVGCANNGMARKISKIEAIFHPQRILGTVSSIPTYDTWGTDNIKVNGRVWINVR